MAITVYRGDDKTLTGYVTDADNLAVNITGWSLVFSAAPKRGDPVTFQIDAVITDAAAGKFIVHLSRATHTKDVARYVFDVQATTLDDKVHTIAMDQLSIVQDVTP